jgi:hypothetical protein
MWRLEMSEKVYIEIDAGTWLDATGVETTVYLGDACDPCYTKKESYVELINRELEAHTVHGKLTNVYGHDNIGAAENFVLALEQAATYAYERFQELKGE